MAMIVSQNKFSQCLCFDIFFLFETESNETKPLQNQRTSLDWTFVCFRILYSLRLKFISLSLKELKHI